MNTKIKVGYLISYDYTYLKNSLDSIYPYADEITLCYDKNFKTWSGNDFNIPSTFFEEISEYDKNKKIKIYTDNFYIPENKSNPMLSETFQRNKLGEFMGNGGWHIQLDVDEYVYDFKKMMTFLKKSNFLLKNPEKNPVSLIAQFIVLYKKDKNGFFVINPIKENFYLATNNPKYIRARQTAWVCLDTKHKVLHQSWAREPHEIEQKLNNWGHKNDFNGREYFNKWLSVDSKNYKNILNFHPINPNEWHKLEYINIAIIEELIKKIKDFFPQEKPYAALLELKRQIKLPFLLKIELKIRRLFSV